MKAMEFDSVEDALNTIQKMRQWQPFKWSGKWFLVDTTVVTKAYRTKASALKESTKHTMAKVFEVIL